MELILFLIIVIMAGLAGYIVGDAIGYDRGRQDERRYLKRTYGHRMKQQKEVLEDESTHHDSADWWKKVGGRGQGSGEWNDSRWN